MKTYTDTHSGEKFLAGLYPASGNGMLLRFCGMRPDDRPHEIQVPAKLKGKAMCAIKRPDADRLLSVAELCGIR